MLGGLDPPLERFDALEVLVERLFVEALVVGDTLRAVGVDDPGEGELVGEFDRLFDECFRVGCCAAIHQLMTLILRFDTIHLPMNQH